MALPPTYLYNVKINYLPTILKLHTFIFVTLEAMQPTLRISNVLFGLFWALFNLLSCLHDFLWNLIRMIFYQIKRHFLRSYGIISTKFKMFGGPIILDAHSG